MCQGLNPHYFHIMGDGHQPNTRGLYTHYQDSLLKGGMTIPNIATFDHGTYKSGRCISLWCRGTSRPISMLSMVNYFQICWAEYIPIGIQSPPDNGFMEPKDYMSFGSDWTSLHHYLRIWWLMPMALGHESRKLNWVSCRYWSSMNSYMIQDQIKITYQSMEYVSEDIEV